MPLAALCLPVSLSISFVVVVAVVVQKRLRRRLQWIGNLWELQPHDLSLSLRPFPVAATAGSNTVGYAPGIKKRDPNGSPPSEAVNVPATCPLSLTATALMAVMPAYPEAMQPGSQ